MSRLDNGEALPFTQTGSRVQIGNVPATDETGLWPALRIECDGPPVVYQTGGLRLPKVSHPTMTRAPQTSPINNYDNHPISRAEKTCEGDHNVGLFLAGTPVAWRWLLELG